MVQVLASILYGVGLLTLIQMAVLAAGGGLIAANAVATGVANLFALVVALNSLLLGKGVTRGSYVSWLATLILTALFVVQGVLSILTAPTGSSALVIVVPVPVCAVAVLALLLTRAVRQHCPKKVTPAR